VESTATFNPGTGANGTVNCVAVQADGKIVLAGSFTTVNGLTRIRIARLNLDGTVESTATFNPGTGSDGTANSVAVQADGKIVIGGSLTSVNGQPRFGIARLLPNGNVEDTATFYTGTGSNSVRCVALQPDGRILLGGYFSSIDGQPRYSIARLNADGSVESTATFNVGTGAGINGTVYSVVVQADGKILLCGDFAGVNSQARGGVARLFGNGAVESTSTFNPGTGDNGTTYCVTMQADGKLLLGGTFTTYNGQTRNKIARLANDAATESFDLPSRTQLQWLRGGAGPELDQVTFDLSTNNGASWILLGPGTRIAGGWELVGQALPATGQLRARGRVAGGNYNGSAGLVETVAAFSFGPEISVQQPAPVNLGAGVTLTAIGSGVGSLSYQWKKDGVTIPGANGSSFSIPNSQPWHVGDYTVLVTDANGTTTSNGVLLAINGTPTGIWRGLLAYYPFDGNALDRELGAAHATVSGALLTTDRLGRSNRAFAFDGINDKLTATVPSLPVGNAPRTLSLWAKAQPDPARSVGLVRWGLAQNGRAFGIANKSSPYTWQGETFGTGPGLNSGVLVDSKWHHVCLTYDGAVLSIFLDGVLRQTTSAGVLDTGLSALLIGVGVNGTSFYPGLLDEVRIYNRALSPTEVQQLKASEDPDSDGDGILDRFETGTGVFVSAENTGTSPTNSDSDGDGLTDGQEVNTYHSNPNVRDTDGDGFEDGFEVLTGFSPTSSASTPDAFSSALPAIEYRFNAALGISCRIEASTDLATWGTIETNIIGNGGVIIRFYSTEGQPRRFFRARRN